MVRVVVIGGGVIGLSCGYHLARAGAKVIIVDRAAPGGGCSAGNLGWIVPSLSEPLPAPGLTWQSLKYMLRRDSPLYIDPVFALTGIGWLWQFWRHCNKQDYHHGLEAVGALNKRTFALYDQLRADSVEFECHRAGLLFLFLSERALTRALADFQALADLGLANPTRLDRDGVLAIEPRLAPDVYGGILIEHEGHVRPETLCSGLATRIKELGGGITSGLEVTGLVRRNGLATALEAAGGRIEGDAFVLAAGAWSGRVGRSFGVSLPVQPGKGYSVTLTDPTASPSHAMYLYEMRVGISPFTGAVRLGGTMELSGFTDRVVPERVAAIRRAAARYLPGAIGGPAETVWTGMRPLTPDGLPLIGRAPGFENLYVATGHAMLGVTLAPVTGSAISELVMRGKPSPELQPFDPGRFG